MAIKEIIKMGHPLLLEKAKPITEFDTLELNKLIKDMIENNKAPTEKVVKHIDRCLSCYACMTTCPSGVNYMHIIDHGRNHIERNYKRPFLDRWLRNMLSYVLPRPNIFILLGWLIKITKPLSLKFLIIY